MLSVSTQMVPTPVSVWRTSLATDAPAGPGEPHSPKLPCTSTTNSLKGPNRYNYTDVQPRWLKTRDMGKGNVTLTWRCWGSFPEQASRFSEQCILLSKDFHHIWKHWILWLWFSSKLVKNTDYTPAPLSYMFDVCWRKPSFNKCTATGSHAVFAPVHSGPNGLWWQKGFPWAGITEKSHLFWQTCLICPAKLHQSSWCFGDILNNPRVFF